MEKNEAVLMSVKCSRTHKSFFARYDRAYDGVYVLTYGLKEAPQDVSGSSGEEGGEVKIDLSNSRTGPQYKCPYCGAVGFVRCGSCGKLTCYDYSGHFTCEHCGSAGSVEGTIASLSGERKRSQ